jgi:hypothetical protein
MGISIVAWFKPAFYALPARGFRNEQENRDRGAQAREVVFRRTDP